MKIIISNTEFPYNEGCKLLKLKHKDCPMDELSDIWNDIVPMTFQEIGAMQNVEQRRVGMLCFGLERLINEVKPKLIDKQTLSKSTMWVDNEGNITEHKFNDTYELYEVSGNVLSEGLSSWQKIPDSYFIKCKDTSTDREYLIWVEPRSVYNTNNDESARWNFNVSKINAIQCVAWTIQTNVPKGKIEKIVRQGDCILIKPRGKYEPLRSARHLTEKEYKTLLVAES